MNDSGNKNKILMIGGTGRSGTSILSKIFENHARVAVAPEWRFMVDPDGIIDYLNTAEYWSPYHADIRIKRLENVLLEVANDNLFLKIISKLVLNYIERPLGRKLSRQYQGITATRCSPNFSKLSKELIHNLYEFEFDGHWTGFPALVKSTMYYAGPRKREELINIFADYYQAIIEDVLGSRKAAYYLEKNTWNILWFDKILQILPGALLVHIYRDPRDVVASFTQQSWMPSEPAQAAHVYLDLYNRWESIKSILPKHSFTELSLEQLTNQPEQTLKSICDFWNIPWESSLMFTDISRSNSGRWKKQFTSSQSDTVHNILKEPLKKLGYE